MTPQEINLELGEKVEKRFEMLLSHHKFGKPIRQILREFTISPATYYYWDKRYQEKGIFSLRDSKRGPKTSPMKTSLELENEITELARQNMELDTKDLHEILMYQHETVPSIATIQRILKNNGINRLKGRRSKKEIEKKRAIVQTLKK